MPNHFMTLGRCSVLEAFEPGAIPWTDVPTGLKNVSCQKARRVGTGKPSIRVLIERQGALGEKQACGPLALSAILVYSVRSCKYRTWRTTNELAIHPKVDIEGSA